ncbi:MAG: bestrophin family ion channel [Bacteroidota bacterium]
MYIKKKYSIKAMITWTRQEIYLFLLIALVPTILYEILDMTFLHLPLMPITLIGTAVAFLIGFQNNAAYGRIWEARKIWGGIVNYSRTWTMMIKDMVSNAHAEEEVSEEELAQHKRVFVHRHIAWMAALRHAMRKKKPWEVFTDYKTNREWLKMMHIPEFENKLEDDLKPLLSGEEHAYVLTKTNKAAALLSLQSKHLRELKDRGLIWEFSFLELENVLKEFFNLQGKSERIKNFPYPRQYATLGYDFVWVFVLLLPFAVIPAFAEIRDGLSGDFDVIKPFFVWLAVPFTATLSWIFHTMQRIGTVGENPFEGSANDVPISTIARGIEIDLREMIDEGEAEIPEPLPAIYDVQM